MLTPLNAAHASNVFPRANPRHWVYAPWGFLFPSNALAKGDPSRGTARAQNAAAPPDGQRQGGRGCAVGSRCPRRFPSLVALNAETHYAGTRSHTPPAKTASFPRLPFCMSVYATLLLCRCEPPISTVPTPFMSPHIPQPSIPTTKSSRRRPMVSPSLSPT